MEDEVPEPWRPSIHGTRMKSTQRYRAHHPRRNVSLSKKRDNDSTEKSIPHLERRGTVPESIAKDPFGIGDDDGDVEEPNNKAQAKNASDLWARRHIKWEKKKPGSPLSPLTSPRTELHHAISPEIKDDPDHDSEFKFSELRNIESSRDKDFQIPRLSDVPHKGDNGQGRIEKIQRHVEDGYLQNGRDSDHDPQFQPPGSADAPLDDDRIKRREFGSWNPSNEQRSDHVQTQEFLQLRHSIDETNDRGNQAVSDKGKKPEETETLSETPSSSHDNERDGLVSQPRRPGSELSLIDASPIHDLVEAQLDSKINETKGAPDTPQSHGHIESISHDSQPKSPGSGHIKIPNPQINGLGSDQNKSPDTVRDPDNHHSPDAMKSKCPDAQLKSPSNNDMEMPDPQPKSPESNHTKSPDTTHFSATMENGSHEPQPMSPETDQNESPEAETKSPETGNVADETNFAQNRVGEDVDRESWLNNSAPLCGNYKAFFRDSQNPRSTNSNLSSGPSSGQDSIILSPTRSGDYANSDEDEDWDRIAVANAEIIRMLDGYKDSSKLQQTSEGQEAKYWRRAKRADEKNRNPQGTNSERASSISTPSSDGSLVMSPGQYDEQSRTRSESVQDDLEEAEEEEEEGEEEDNQAALNLIALHKVNYELRKDIEAKEAKFKEDIKIAWTRPRPPPTTEEQRRNRTAYEDIKSKKIFDELGDQQRPIKADSKLVHRETEINIMLTRARVCYLLEDYRRMYTRANQAAAAASIFEFSPLTARCCYYRGLASYLYRDFSSARDDFLEARGCADLYGISSESIERYIDLTDPAIDPLTVTLERVPIRKVGRGRQAEWTRGTRGTGTIESSPSTPDDATRLVGDPPKPPVHTASAPSLSGSPNKEERSTGQAREDGNPQIQVLRRPSHIGGLLPNDDPQPAAAEVPPYRPPEEAIPEEIRKDIFENKARSLSEAGPAEAILQEENTLPPPSMANTECTLVGSNTSLGMTRRVPRPHVVPITTSFAPVSNPTGRALPRATPDSEDADDRGSDEMGSDEIYAAFGGRPREDGTPNSAQWSSNSE